MNDWPMAEAYQKILQNPKVAFNDPELKQCQIKLDGNGQPLPISGAVAVVFQAELPDGTSHALRAYTSERMGVIERYKIVGDYLDTVHKSSNVPALIRFGCQQKGLRAIVKGTAKWYPLVTMEWVSGVTLYEWVAKRCAASEAPRLRKAADDWEHMISAMVGAKVAHGDLHHENVLVDENDQLKLVDYDCICVPELDAKKELNPEYGIAPYQHPQRGEDTVLTLSIDNFASIFIYVVLRALAAEPRLWHDFVVQTDYDKLLFRESDLEKPSHSELFERLQRSPDPEVKPLVDRLANLYAGKIEDVPTLDSVLKDLFFSYDEIEKKLDDREFDEVVEELDKRNDTSDAPSKLKPRIDNAYERVKCRTRLRTLFQNGDERGMAQLCDSPLLKDYPAAQADVREALTAKQVVPLLDRLEQSRNRQQWRAFVQIWDGNQRILQGRKSAQRFRGDVDTWRPKNQACEAVIRLAGQPDCDPDQLQQAWDRVKSAGGHPEIDGHARQIAQVITRGRAWQSWLATLHQITQGTGGEQLDNQLVRSWNQSLFGGWKTAERERARLVEAQRRLSQLTQLQRVVQQAPSPPTIQSERAILQAATSLPNGYDHAQRPRVETAERRLGHVDQINSALQRQDELELAEQWKLLSSLQGQSLLDAATQDRAKLAERRGVAWESFRPALDQANAAPGEHTDAALDQQWNESLFRGWPLAEQHRGRWDEARRCLAVVSRLDQRVGQAATVTRAGEQEIVSLAAQLPLGYAHRHQNRAEVAQQRLGAAQRLPQLIGTRAEEEQILAAWQAVQQLQATALIDRTTADRGKLADDRLRLWSQVESVLGRLRTAASESHESELLRLWSDPLFKGWPRAEAQRSHRTTAEQHRGVLQELNKAASAPLTLPGEKLVVTVAARLPQSYDYTLRQRVELARQRIASHGRTLEAVRLGTAENAIVAAADELVRLQAEALLDAAVQRRIQLARQRVPALQTLAGISTALPADQYDEQIRQRWRDDLLRDCPEARKWHNRFKLACHRQDLMRRLAPAIARRNEPVIAEIVADPSMAGYPLPKDWVSLVEEVKRATQGAQRLLDAVKNHRRDEFAQSFDIDMIRRCQYLFLGVRQELAAWTREEILPLNRLGLRLSQGRDSVVHLHGNSYRIRWTWPLSRFVKQCIVGVASRPPSDQSDPRNDRSVSHVQSYALNSRNDWCSFFYNGKRRATVYVWAVVDLGFTTLTSPPLALGNVGAAPVAANREVSW